jgi:hypothetical protein
MATALPPEVNGPITPASKQVYITNVLLDSIVTVYADNVKAGQITSTSSGGIWVPLTVTLVAKTPHEEITATQNYQGKDPAVAVTSGESDHSSPVPVEPVPAPLPPPVFVSGLSTCMDSVLIGGLIPGTDVTVLLGVMTVASGVVTQPTQWFNLSPGAIPAKAVLTAQQTLGANKSPVTPSLPVLAAPTKIGPADIATPVRPCQTSIDLSNVTPGADFKVTNNANVSYGTNPWPAYTLDGLPLFQPGTLIFEQYFTRCQAVPGSSKSVPVAAAPLPVPVVTYAACRDVRQLFVSNLLPGEILVLKRVVQTSPTSSTVSVIGSQGVSGSTATVFLPKSFQPTDPAGPVSIRIEIVLCTLTLPPPGYVDAPIAAVGGPYPAPTVPAPLYACARSVAVQSAHPGAIVQIFSGSAATPRSNAVVADAADLVIPVWSPLAAGESIFAQQTGCNANGKSANVGVLGFSSLPTPYIVLPLHPGYTSVSVTGVYPGAQVYLMVNGALRNEVDATATSVTIPTGAPLANQDMVEVIQTLCTLHSGTGTATVSLGTLNVNPYPYTLIRGEANGINVGVNDADATALGPINGLPVIVSSGFKVEVPTGPSVSAVTGMNFVYTPGAKDAVAVALVKGGPAFKDAEATIPLMDPLKVWVGAVGPASAIVYGSGFISSSCKVVVDGEGLIPTATFTGDIVTGIKVRISCINPGQYWTFHVTSLAGGPTVSGQINC